ncbi:galactokinase [Brachybacterium ginsengisoli]|uniref:Galactokinase n=1 Tax=Brachybacterium ginsengisoli TaxID=1331682 RepID=A0A291GU94_9MICO|nr:galactokinase family protein [Brachybacterium ginsengisoli]ATG53732.1 galactokinase [Brachybacterium ginsengisoli]
MTATEVTWAMPGRIEVLGKHTDYGGGRVLVCAVDRGITVRTEEIAGAPGTLEAGSDAFPGALHLEAGTAPDLPAGHWGRYVHTVLARLTDNFGPLRPARLTVTSDLPPASGMSSSSAMITGVAMALADLNDLPSTAAWTEQLADRVALAGYAASIENGKSFGSLAGRPGVGTSGGSLDHTGMLTSEEGQISYAEFDPMRLLDRVALPPEWSFVVAVSGVLAEKTGAAQVLYNRGPELLGDLVARWNRETGRADATVQAALRSLVGEDLEAPLLEGVDLTHAPGPGGAPTDSPLAHDERLAPLRRLAADGAERDRLDQFLLESAVLVPRAHTALRDGDLDAFAAATATSQRLAETHLRNQVPQTITLADSAVQLGARAASAFGAGFGGSVWALVPTADADGFAEQWRECYRRTEGAPETASTLVTRPGAPGRRVGAARV